MAQMKTLPFVMEFAIGSIPPLSIHSAKPVLKAESQRIVAKIIAYQSQNSVTLLRTAIMVQMSLIVDLVPQ